MLKGHIIIFVKVYNRKHKCNIYIMLRKKYVKVILKYVIPININLKLILETSFNTADFVSL